MKRQKRKRDYTKNIIYQYVKNNVQIYIIVIIMFLIGIILGIFFINNVNEEQVIKISSYINNFIEFIKSDGQLSKIELLKASIINNIIIVGILWFLGSTVIGAPLIYLVIGYKGYCIGYTISSIIATLGIWQGLKFIIITMLLQYIIYIPCILSLAVSGIKLYKLIIEDRRREDIKIQILRHTLFCLIMLSALLIGSLIETYVSGEFILLYKKM